MILALGPATEARFCEAFAKVAILNAKDAAKLIGIDVKSLRAMTAAGLIAAVPRGSKPAYTEAALRAYLVSPIPPTAADGIGSNINKGGFLNRPARLRIVARKP